MAHNPESNITVIAFQGSQDPADVITDLTFTKRKLYFKPLDIFHFMNYFRSRGIEETVHRGFMENYLEVRPQILSLLPEQKPDTYFITGHSLGGALAVICTVDIHRQVVAPIKMINFGGPRVGNEAFVTYYNDRPNLYSLRVVNDRDIVTRIPFREMGYSHIKERLTITESGEFMLGRSRGGFREEMGKKLAAGAKKLQEKTGTFLDWFKQLGDEFKDHYRADYDKTLAND